MVQKKKPVVNEAILAAADSLFREKGYVGVSMGEIARAASVSPANIYVYFPSKLDLLLAVYEPWLRDQIEQMCEIASAINDPRERVRYVLRDVWRDLPSRENGFATSLVQALSLSSTEDVCSRDLLIWAEQRVEAVLLDAMPEARRAMLRDGVLARLIFMAFDGFVMKRHASGPCERVDQVVDVMSILVAGSDGAAGEAAAALNS